MVERAPLVYILNFEILRPLIHNSLPLRSGPNAGWRSSTLRGLRPGDHFVTFARGELGPVYIACGYPCLVKGTRGYWKWQIPIENAQSQQFEGQCAACETVQHFDDGV